MPRTTNTGTAPIAPGAPPPGASPEKPLPHERDEASGQAAAEPDPVIEQAHRDIESGQVDTDMRATPGLDAARRATLVPVEPVKPGPQDGNLVVDRKAESPRGP